MPMERVSIARMVTVKPLRWVKRPLKWTTPAHHHHPY